jgi:diguanylate cyclase (GGDEF)-like protein
LMHATPLHDTDGEIVGHLEIFGQDPCKFVWKQHDVCVMLAEVATLVLQQSLLYQTLVYHSTHDPLTDLPNGRLCEDRLRNALAEAAQANNRVTVVYIDVDRFKDVNDLYGHKTGDSYLKLLSSRLRSAVRSVDTLARVGGDEFMIIVPHKQADVDLMALEKRLCACFAQPFEIEGQSFTGSASFGMASFPEHGVTAEELQHHADEAMYVAKRRTSSKNDPPRNAASRPPQLAVLAQIS